jgi:hypothetical protein
MHKKERPIIADLLNDGTLEIEKFQNEVIRPIIKMQHNLFVGFLKNYLQKRKIDFSILTESEKRSKVSSVFKTDNNYKNTTLGFVLGQFSLDEFNAYTNNSSEINKRILQIILQRIKDSNSEV